MVNKLCAICGRYFGGELNGDYLCPECAPSNRTPLHPMSSLDGSVIAIESLAGLSVGERRAGDGSDARRAPGAERHPDDERRAAARTQAA